MASSILPYKVLVTNKALTLTDGAGMSGLEFLSLSDAQAFATAITTDYSAAKVYIWDGSTITQYT